MKLEMKTSFAILLLVLFVACIFCVGWVGVAGAVELPSTPTPAPTMDPWDDIIYPTPMPLPTRTPIPTYEFYLPVILRQNRIISWLGPTPTLAPAPTWTGGN